MFDKYASASCRCIRWDEGKRAGSFFPYEIDLIIQRKVLIGKGNFPVFGYVIRVETWNVKLWENSRNMFWDLIFKLNIGSFEEIVSISLTLLSLFLSHSFIVLLALEPFLSTSSTFYGFKLLSVINCIDISLAIKNQLKVQTCSFQLLSDMSWSSRTSLQCLKVLSFITCYCTFNLFSTDYQCHEKIF